MADTKPPAGWYPHPSMADTRRYWDGAHWTDHIEAHVGPRRDELAAKDKAIKRVALLVGMLFLAPVLALTFVGPSVGGVDCGNWISPRFTDLTVATMQAEIAMNGGSRLDRAALAAGASECNDRLDSRRTLALSLIAMGIIARLGIPPVARSLRR